MERLARRAFASARSLAELFSRRRTLGLAAELAFWLFLSLVPLFVVAGLAVAASPQSRGHLLFWLALPPEVEGLLRAELDRVGAWSGGVTLSVATAGFLWTASSGVHAAFDGFDAQLGATRGWPEKRAKALLFCVCLVVVSAAMLLALAHATFLDWLAVPSFGRSLAKTALGLAANAGFVALLYRLGLPKEHRHHVVRAACFVALADALLVLAYGAYLRLAADAGAFGAGLQGVAATLITLYLFSLSLLVGASFASGWPVPKEATTATSRSSTGAPSDRTA
jgi:membrane protein